MTDVENEGTQEELNLDQEVDDSEAPEDGSNYDALFDAEFGDEPPEDSKDGEEGEHSPDEE